jgi:hypothetical protein
MAEDRIMADERTAIANRNTPVDLAAIPGWGVDADPENDPTYPYRDRSRDEGLRSDWKRPPQQSSEVEILQSIEHIRKPAVFGTAVPPRGVSGMIRRGAFRWSESNWIRWLLLMGADRINVVEGVVADLARLKVPNIPAEMGIRSEWKHNKQGLAKKVAVTAAIGLAAYALLRRPGRDREGEPSERE